MYLGIIIKNHDDGGFEFTQPGLIQKILDTTKTHDHNAKPAPTNTEKPLGSDPNGKPPC